MEKAIPLYKCIYTVNKNILDLICSIAYKCGKLTTLNMSYPKAILDANETSYLLELTGIKINQSKIRALSRGEKVADPKQADAIYKLLSRLSSFDPNDISSIEKFEKTYFVDGVPNRMAKKLDDFPFQIPPHNKIDQLLKGLHKFFESKDGASSPLIFAALSFFEIISIAPYSNSNIILAYLYSKAFLGKYCGVLRQIPLAKLLSRSKEKLNESLEESASRGDCTSFFSYFFELVDSSLDELSHKGVKKTITVSNKVEGMLEKMEKGKFYCAAELLEMLNLKSRLGLHKNYIRPALDANLIIMSNPLSPTDRTQRYMRKEK